MKKLIGLSVLAALVLVGCASGMPDWVSSGQSKQYHTNQYIAAVGEGSDVDSAGEQARLKIEKIFGPRFDYKTLNSLSSAMSSLTANRRISTPSGPLK